MLTNKQKSVLTPEEMACTAAYPLLDLLADACLEAKRLREFVSKLAALACWTGQTCYPCLARIALKGDSE